MNLEQYMSNMKYSQDKFSDIKNKKSFKCPVCKKAKYFSMQLLQNHIIKEHSQEIPDGMPVEQFIFNMRNKKTHGNCVICKKPTEWNPTTNKYKRFCSDSCKEKYVKIAKERLLKTYGTDNLAKNPEHQKKMLENRKISKKYTYSNGQTINCVGSYEYDFIKYNDEVLNIGYGNIQECEFIFYYNYENKERFYIPDFYIPDLNLLIEIKDKDNNHPNISQNMKAMDVEKFKAVIDSNKYNFIVVAGEEYEPYVELIEYLRNRENNDLDDKKIIVEIPKDVYKYQFSNSNFSELQKGLEDLKDNLVFQLENLSIENKTEFAFIRLYEYNFKKGANPFNHALKTTINFLSEEIKYKGDYSHAAMNYSLKDDFQGLYLVPGEKNDVKIEPIAHWPEKDTKDPKTSLYAVFSVPLTASNYRKLKSNMNRLQKDNNFRYDVLKIAYSAVYLSINKIKKELFSNEDNKINTKMNLVCSTFVAYMLSQCSDEIKEYVNKKGLDNITPKGLTFLPGVKLLFKGIWMNYEKDAKKFVEKNSQFKKYL